MKPLLTAERVRELFDYCSETGQLTRRIALYNTSFVAGQRAGSIHNMGYRRVCVDMKYYLEHRLIWLLVTGAFPTMQVDHRNGVRNDNRWENLREATPSENGQNRGLLANSTSGFTGVNRQEQSGKWRAQIYVAGRRKYLGVFATREEARDAYLDAKSKLHVFQPAPRRSDLVAPSTIPLNIGVSP